MEKKVCTKCKEEKELTEFHIGRSECKLCRKKYYENNKDKIKEYEEKNKDKIKEYKKKYIENNIDKIKEYKQEYYGKNKERINKNGKEYYENNKDKIKEYYGKNKERNRNRNNQYVRLRIQSDPIYRLTHNIRVLIGNSIKNKGYNKKTKTYKILGCTYEEFKTQIVSQWEEWMNWDNYGLCDHKTKNYGWDLDHIIPLSSGECEEDIIRLNHHSNIQPLCSYVNRYVKRDKII